MSYDTNHNQIMLNIHTVTELEQHAATTTIYFGWEFMITVLGFAVTSEADQSLSPG